MVVEGGFCGDEGRSEIFLVMGGGHGFHYQIPIQIPKHPPTPETLTSTNPPPAGHRKFWSLRGAGEGADGAVVAHGCSPPHVY